MLVRMLGVEGDPSLGEIGLGFISKEDFLDLPSSVMVGLEGISVGSTSVLLISGGLVTVMFRGGDSSASTVSSSA